MFRAYPPRALEPGERQIMNIRRHGIILLGRLMPQIIIMSVPLVLIIASLFTYGRAPESSRNTITLSLKFLLLLLLPMALWAAYNAFDWINDSFHVTSRRVIRFEQKFITSQRLIEARLDQIQNISVLVPDPLANLVHYGTVIIETAAQGGQIVFDSVAEPRKIQRLLFELRGLPPPQEKPAEPPLTLYDLLLTIFPVRPQQKADGSVTYHKHWFILLQAMIWPTLLLLLVLAAAIIIRHALPLILLLVVIPMLLYQYANWVNDIYVLTDSRIIDIVRIPLIREERREALLERIQNVSFTIPNILSRLLDMGDVFVETAGEAVNFNFVTVHHPEAIKDEINRRLDTVRAARRQSEEEARLRQTEEMILKVVHRHYGPPPMSSRGDTSEPTSP